MMTFLGLMWFIGLGILVALCAIIVGFVVVCAIIIGIGNAFSTRGDD